MCALGDVARGRASRKPQKRRTKLVWIAERVEVVGIAVVASASQIGRTVVAALRREIRIDH